MNLSRTDLMALDLAPYFREPVRRYRILPRYLELEVSESVWIACPEEARETGAALREAGFRLVMDGVQEEFPGAVPCKAPGVDALKLDLRGLGAGAGFILLKTLLRPTVISPRELEDTFGLELLGEIPERRGTFSRRLSPAAEDDGPAGACVRDSFLSAAYILSHRLGPEKAQCIYITSAEQGEGKTAVAARLAVQLAGLEHKVLLIDLDVRSPSLGGLFLEAPDYAHTLNALYRGDATAREAVVSLTGCLDLLPSMLEPRGLPLGDAMMDLIRELARDYDYVLIDSAPVGQAPETLSLNQVARSALFVVRFDHASLRSIRSALDRLEKSGVRTLGCIVNRVSGPVRPAPGGLFAGARRPRSAGSHSKGFAPKVLPAV